MQEHTNFKKDQTETNSENCLFRLSRHATVQRIFQAVLGPVWTSSQTYVGTPRSLLQIPFGWVVHWWNRRDVVAFVKALYGLSCEANNGVSSRPPPDGLGFSLSSYITCVTSLAPMRMQTFSMLSKQQV